GMPAHHLDEADPAFGPTGFDVPGADRLDRDAERGLEPEAALDVEDIVVDRLGNTDDGQRIAASLRLLRDGDRAAQRSVTTDREQDIHALAHERIHHRAGVLRAA